VDKDPEAPNEHLYHAEATVLKGHLHLPLSPYIHPQAFARLPEEGGYISQHAHDYRLEHVIAYSRAYTQVAGNQEIKKGRGFNTLSTAVVEGLNVLDVVTADRVVAQLSTEHPLQRGKHTPRISLLGTRFAKKPIELDVPVMITGMSWGALSYNAKVALARGARAAGSSNTTGDGGMLMAERENSRTLIYEVLPSRYGINIHHMRMADAIELTIGQGAKPGTGGLLLGSKVSDTIAKQRDLPVGVDQRSPARHPDFLGPDDMIIKVEELREATDWQVPIFIKMGASRVFDDVKLAAKAGADVIVVDGMEGGTGASPAILQEHTGIPTLAAVCEARAALEDIGLYGEVQLIIAGGIRDGVDAAKAIELGQGQRCVADGKRLHVRVGQLRDIAV